MEETIIRPIARYYGDLGEKFGVPRQAGVVEELEGRVVFEPAYRDPEALRGIEGFDRLWLIWQFSENLRPEGDWSPTVRPPRLGGNTRMGVFATRSPFRPNALGLSCVRLLGLEKDPERGTVLRIGGADLMDGTPIFDIKPYIPYADAHPEARSGFAPDAGGDAQRWSFPRAGVACARGKAIGPPGRAGKRPPPPVSERPGAGVWPQLRRTERKIHRGRRPPHGERRGKKGRVKSEKS